MSAEPDGGSRESPWIRRVVAEMVRGRHVVLHGNVHDEALWNNQFTPVPQKLENVRFSGGKPLEHAAVKSAIADAEQRLNGSGRVLVRASGTEPLIRIMAEGDDEKLVGQLVREIAGAVRGAV